MKKVDSSNLATRKRAPWRAVCWLVKGAKPSQGLLPVHDHGRFMIKTHVVLSGTVESLASMGRELPRPH